MEREAPYWISIPAIWPFVVVYLLAILDKTVHEYVVLTMIPITMAGIIVSAYTVSKYYKRWK